MGRDGRGGGDGWAWVPRASATWLAVAAGEERAHRQGREGGDGGLGRLGRPLGDFPIFLLGACSSAHEGAPQKIAKKIFRCRDSNPGLSGESRVS